MLAGQYIKRIEIDALWNKQRAIRWNLHPEVNILSGVNGVGKSTIINRVVMHLLQTAQPMPKDKNVRLTFAPAEAETVDFDVIRSIDSPLLSAEFLNRVTDALLQSELDVRLYQLQRKYLDYQVNLSNRMVQLFTSNVPDAQAQAQKIASEKTEFQNIIDSLFKETGKRIERQHNEIFFSSMGETIPPYKLSSGEKQMLIILLTMLVQDKKPHVLFLDEPEVSLHIEWQEQLIGLMRQLNPNCQLILTTHSPAVIMNGWTDCVVDVDDITINN